MHQISEPKIWYKLFFVSPSLASSHLYLCSYAAQNSSDLLLFFFCMFCLQMLTCKRDWVLRSGRMSLRFDPWLTSFFIGKFFVLKKKKNKLDHAENRVESNGPKFSHVPLEATQRCVPSWHIPQKFCRILWERFVWNIFFVFPEVHITLKSQKMPNHTNTGGCHTATIGKTFWKIPSHERDTAKRCIPQMPTLSRILHVITG